jgi:crotonobetainyl-CoA:carnitine CoA-transferase CaiB-like acyl-CoA transferase
VIGAGNDSQFAKLCKCLNLEYLISDSRFLTNQDRVKNREALVIS